MNRSSLVLTASLLLSLSAAFAEDVRRNVVALRGADAPAVEEESFKEMYKNHLRNIKASAVVNFGEFTEDESTESTELAGADWATFDSGVFSMVMYMGASSCNANPMAFYQHKFGSCEVLPPAKKNDPPTDKWVKYSVKQNAMSSVVSMQIYSDVACDQPEGKKKLMEKMDSCKQSKKDKGTFTENFAVDFMTAGILAERYSGVIAQFFTSSDCSDDSLVDQQGYLAFVCQQMTNEKGKVTGYYVATDIDIKNPGNDATTLSVYGPDDKYCHGKFQVMKAENPFSGYAAEMCSPDPMDSQRFVKVSKF